MREKKHTFKMPVIDWKKYKGMQVAVVEGKVVASGYTASEVYNKAQRKYPDKPSEEIILASIPRYRRMFYLLSL